MDKLLIMASEKRRTRPPLFELRNITKSYEGRTVLSDFSLKVSQGHWIGILGESGSGKSTLLQIAGRFTDADSGTVRFGNNLLPPVASQLLRGYPGITLVHQDYHLFPNQTVAENIFYPLRLHPPAASYPRTEALLALANLTDVRDKKAKFLSGGQKQRTAIAAAVAEVPSLLLLDEPFAHLDALNRTRLSALFHALKKEEGQTCLFVTHDPSEALDWADYLVVMQQGKIVQEGLPYAIYENPASPYVAALTGKINWLDASQTSFIRPERLRVLRRPLKHTRHSAEVKAVHFKGTHWEYETVLNNGLPFLVYRLQNDLSPGQHIGLSYRPGDVRHFR